jgi:hypothetical protein
VNKKGLPGRTPKTDAPFIRGSSGVFGVRMYRSFGSSFSSAGVYIFCWPAILPPAIALLTAPMTLSAISIEILIRFFLSSPQTNISFFPASACLQFNRLSLDYQVLTSGGRGNIRIQGLQKLLTSIVSSLMI